MEVAEDASMAIVLNPGWAARFEAEFAGVLSSAVGIPAFFFSPLMVIHPSVLIIVAAPARRVLVARQVGDFTIT
jgi:hypothetical protein